MKPACLMLLAERLLLERGCPKVNLLVLATFDDASIDVAILQRAVMDVEDVAGRVIRGRFH
jgi:hypothetical protein